MAIPWGLGLPVSMVEELLEQGSPEVVKAGDLNGELKCSPGVAYYISNEARTDVGAEAHACKGRDAPRHTPCTNCHEAEQASLHIRHRRAVEKIKSCKVD